MVLAGCGSDEPASLTLTLGPRVLPADTVQVEVYVLPAVVLKKTITCELFVGPRATENIEDYTASLVVPKQSEPLDPAVESAISVTGLPEGTLFFVIIASNNIGNPLAKGCGSGLIERGKKTIIPILLEQV